MRFLILGLAAALGTLAVPATAAGASAEQAVAASDIRQAEERGRLLWLYDQAAWHATDALLTVVKAADVVSPKGYVVVPREGDAMLDVIFVVERSGELRQFARFTVDGDKVVRGGIVQGELPPLDPLSARMFAARAPALAAMEAQQVRFCGEAAPNTAILPPDSAGNIAVYLLSSPTSNDVYPMGGHYRADVAPDGRVLSTTRYMNSCYDLPTAQQKSPDGSPGHAGIGYLLGNAPSEIHAFVSYYIPRGFMVVTPSNRTLWLVEKGRISVAKQDLELPAR